MKMNLLGAAAFSLLLVATSCNDEIIEKANYGQTDNLIKFQTVLGKQTKASEMTKDGLEKIAVTGGKPIAVRLFAGETITEDPLYSWNLVNTASSGDAVWSYDNGPVAQPGYAVKYYAWHPQTIATELKTGSNAASASINYTVSSELDDQEDLIVAMDSIPDAEVKLKFNHILSQVNFAVQGIHGIRVQVKNIKVNKVAEKATYTFPAWDSETGTEGGWDSYDGSVTDVVYAYQFNYDKTESVDKYTNDTISTGTNAQIKLGVTDNALMLLPQDFTSSSEGNFSVTFNLLGMDGTAITGMTEKTVTANFKDFDVSKWEMGRRYLYIIDFSNYLVKKEITFKVEVNKWDSEEGEEEDAPRTELGNIAQTLQVSDATQGSIEAAIEAHNKAKETDGDLKIFPISVVGATITQNIELTLLDASKYGKFVDKDEIRIKCKDKTEAAKIILASDQDTYWTRVENTESDTVILKKTGNDLPTE